MLHRDRYIAANRFGLGASSSEIAQIERPKPWLIEQIEREVSRPSIQNVFPSSADIVGEGIRARQEGKEARKMMLKEHRQLFLREMAARTEWRVTTSAPFLERWVSFWTNHFTVSTVRKPVVGLAGSFEREAIRSHCLGRFEDMLLAVTRHPAMLLYLDNVRSVGPNSRVGARNRGLNENLAREIMELHTLGVNGGYEETDVQAFAKVLTGWGIRKKSFHSGSAFAFNERAHEPGSKRILGQRLPEGEVGGVQALKLLAGHPSTARFIAHKIAAHFIHDYPPKKLVDELARVFEQTGGNLRKVAVALVTAPLAWSGAPRKLKMPWEWVVSLARGTGTALPGKMLVKAQSQLGQRPFSAPSPKGWSYRERDWIGPEAILGRLDFAERAARVLTKRGLNVDETVSNLLGPLLTEHTKYILRDTLNTQQKWVLFLMSPEFQRR
jgi:uncharacterized protein (DUF1800 family)